jgi:hypothetical protein
VENLTKRRRVDPPMLATDYFTSCGYPPEDTADLYRMLRKLRILVGKDATFKKRSPSRPVAVSYVQFEPTRADCRRYGKREYRNWRACQGSSLFDNLPAERVKESSNGDSILSVLDELSTLATQITNVISKLRQVLAQSSGTGPGIHKALGDFLAKLREEGIG